MVEAEEVQDFVESQELVASRGVQGLTDGVRLGWEKLGGPGSGCHQQVGEVGLVSVEGSASVIAHQRYVPAVPIALEQMHSTCSVQDLRSRDQLMERTFKNNKTQPTAGTIRVQMTISAVESGLGCGDLNQVPTKAPTRRLPTRASPPRKVKMERSRDRAFPPLESMTSLCWDRVLHFALSTFVLHQRYPAGIDTSNARLQFVECV
jgi:hypothetical protein